MEARGWRVVRFAGADGVPRLGALDPARPTEVRHLAEADPVAAILNGLPCGDVVVEARDSETLELPVPWRLLAPTVAPETWCAGVTYERSRDARLSEAQTEARDVYALVYKAERPELFLKDAYGRRTIGPGGQLGVRSDQSWTVPEPELALFLSGTGALLGATIGNDVSSRDIEGANPLYIPQAKIFGGCAAIGPAILVPDDWSAPFRIELTIHDAGGAVLFAGETSTARLRRGFADLASWLVRENPVPSGTILMTGTGLIPPDDFNLVPGHVVDVRISGIGLLRNTVGTAAEARP